MLSHRPIYTDTLLACAHLIYELIYNSHGNVKAIKLLKRLDIVRFYAFNCSPHQMGNQALWLRKKAIERFWRTDNLEAIINCALLCVYSV